MKNTSPNHVLTSGYPICGVTKRPWKECDCGSCERGPSTKRNATNAELVEMLSTVREEVVRLEAVLRVFRAHLSNAREFERIAPDDLKTALNKAGPDDNAPLVFFIDVALEGHAVALNTTLEKASKDGAKAVWEELRDRCTNSFSITDVGPINSPSVKLTRSECEARVAALRGNKTAPDATPVQPNVKS